MRNLLNRPASIHCLVLLLALVAGPVWAQICPVPGKDGNVFEPNTYYPGVGTANSGSSSINVGSRRIDTNASSIDVSAGDQILIIQMQDASINNSNSSSYGDGASGSGYTALNSAGYYEFAIVQSFSAGVITTVDPITHSYRAAGATASTGRQTFQVLRVPSHDDLTISGTLNAPDWNGRTGGVFVLDVAGTLTASGATIDANGSGFRGGGSYDGGTSLNAVNDTTWTSTGVVSGSPVFGNKGEGIAGTPDRVRGNGGGFSGISANLTSATQGFTGGDLGYPNSLDAARGAPGNAGGGGGEHNAGGGGGSNYGAGGIGGNSYGQYSTTGGPGCVMYAASFYGCGGDGARPVGGRGGAALTTAIGDFESRLFTGGGGGGGSNNNATDDNPAIPQSSGGNGGGVILLRAYNLVDGGGGLSLISRGQDGQPTGRDGAGGGGAGGSVLLLLPNGTYSFVTADVRGGDGGDTGAPLQDNETQGPGGGGGGGSILLPTGVNIGTTQLSGGNTGVNFPDDANLSIFNALGAASGGGSVVNIVYDPDIVALAAECVAIDFGDAPAGYPVTVAQDGARHSFLGSSLFLGAGIEASLEGQPSAAANADSFDDGVSFLGPLQPGKLVDLQVTASDAGLLNAWIDYGISGDWNGAQDQIFDDQPLVAGVNNLQIYVPLEASTGTSYARFRLDDSGGLAPTGKTLGGEVEDYQLSLSAAPICEYPGAQAIWSYEGSLNDSSGFGRNAQANTVGPSGYNSNTFVSGSSSVILNGSSDLIHYSVDGEFLEAAFTDMSVMMWIRPDSLAGNQVIWDEGGTTNGVALTLEGGNLVGSIREANVEVNTSVAFPTDGLWHHIGMSWSGSDNVFRLFLNGVEVDTAGTSFGPDLAAHGSNSGIGNNNAGNAADITGAGTGFAGLIDEIVYFSSDQASNMADFFACLSPVYEPLDFGDAPDSGVGPGPGDYRSLLASDGPRHLIVPGLHLGDTAPDVDSDANQNSTASGDDTTGTADEGAAQLLTSGFGSAFPQLLISDTAFEFDVDLTNSLGPAYLYAWVDWDQSGTFDEDEMVTGGPLTVAVSDTMASLSFALPVDAVLGNTFMRLRLTTDLLVASGGGEDERSHGFANDGEVEDYRVTLQGVDYGDAPASYATLRADGGPSHLPLGTLFIGDDPADSEADGLPGVDALGDDNSGAADEGGFFIPTMQSTDTSYSIDVPLTNQTGETATLFGWLDFEINGDFTGVGEGVSVSVPDGATSATLTWPGFTLGAGTVTFLRLRLTTDPAITTTTPGGPAEDGEIEDHAVAIGQFDWGDAPDTYGTDKVAGNSITGIDQVGPHHLIDTDLAIGDAPLPTSDGQPTANAQGGGPDEDNSFIGGLPFLADTATNYSIEVAVTNTTGSDAELVGWIDFDRNGFFDNDEAARVLVADSASQVTLTWSTIPGDMIPGDSFLRLRLTSDGSVATGDPATSSPYGLALDGEIEDHLLVIETGYDYGDAPDTYGTLAASGGPRHRVDADLFIGNLVPDAEPDGQPDSFADGDDNGGANDEGGLFLTTLQPDSTNYTVNVPLTNNTGSNATLYGWLDINQDGVFSNSAPELQSTTVANGATSATLVFTWVTADTSGGNGLDAGNTFLRLRLSTDAGLGPTQALPTDFASDGEVEDHPVQVSILTCDRLYGMYDDNNAAPFSWRYLREYDNDTVDLPGMPTTKESAGIGIDRIYRRLYYVERVDAVFTPGDGNNLYFYDPALAPGPVHIDTGGNLPVAGPGVDDNYNRMAFSFEGRGAIVTSGNTTGGTFAVHLFDPTPSGTGQFVTPPIPMQNAASILGSGGDIAFDRDDNLYMVSYTFSGGAPYFYYLYEIRFYETGDTPGVDPEVPIGDVILNASSGTNYFAFAELLLTETKPGTEQIAGMAFNFDNLIYLQADLGQTYTWNVGITATGGSGAIQFVGTRQGSSDLGSCIYPFIRAILEPRKTVANVTSGGSGFVPGDVLEYSIVVRNAGGFPSFDTIFQDDIPAGTTYVPNSATMNGDPVPDIGGLMPYEAGRLINTDGQADGVVLADITPGIVGDNEVVITFRVRVDEVLNTATICNQGFVDFEANLLPGPIPTDNPATSDADDPTCRTQTTGYRVSGYVYEDFNVDGLRSPGEPGIGGVALVLFDQLTSQCQSVLTDANGFYQFNSVAAGPKTITERVGSLVPVPAVCPPPAMGIDPGGFVSSTVNQRVVYVVNADIGEVNFGDVALPRLSPNLQSTIAPGGIQTYSHLFTAPTDGLVEFSVANSEAPLLPGWTSVIYEDLDCSGELSLNDSIISAPVSMVAGQSLCLIHRVFAPSTAVAGNTLLSEITATYNYSGSLVSDQQAEANDFTTVLESGEGALTLVKNVRNISTGSPEFDAQSGVSNAARPGDRLRYEIRFANNGVGNITDLNIYDVIPAFTRMAESLDVGCDYVDPLTSQPLAEIPPSLTCQLISPSSAGPNNNLPGYRGNLHWQLDGTLAPGQTGLIVFTVDVD